MREIVSKIVGVSFENRQEHVQKVEPGCNLFWKHEKDNPYDANAIAVFVDPERMLQVGHLKRELAADVVAAIADGQKMRIIAEQVTGGKEKQSFGLNVRIVLDD